MTNCGFLSVTVLFTMLVALPADADLVIVAEPEAHVSQELRGSWRVVAFYNDDSGRVEPIFEDSSNIWISYYEEEFTINVACDAISGYMEATDGFYVTLGDTASTISLCEDVVPEPIRLFSIAYPVDGYYHVIADRLHLFNVDGDHRITLLRNLR